MSEEFTTNAHDLAEAARLQAQLEQDNSSTANNNSSSSSVAQHQYRIPSVSIDSGAYKYVLITALPPNSSSVEVFVHSKRGAHYHRNVAEPLGGSY